MSRRRLPRRLNCTPRTIFAAIGALFAAAAVLAPLGARAQSAEPSGRERETAGARTDLGTPNAQACSEYAAAGQSSEEALAVCDRALSSERLSRANQLATRINRGALHLLRRDGEAALADFDAVAALVPRHAEAQLNRGAALVMMGRPGPAVAAITEALSLGVREPHKAYFNRAGAREALGDVRGAYEDYSTALEIQPDWGPSGAELARFARARREQLANILNQSAP